jgi:hypothetical protein
MRLATATPALLVDADTSEFATKAKVTEVATKHRQNIRFALTESERQRWHTERANRTSTSSCSGPDIFKGQDWAKSTPAEIDRELGETTEQQQKK